MFMAFITENVYYLVHNTPHDKMLLYFFTWPAMFLYYLYSKIYSSKNDLIKLLLHSYQTYTTQTR